MLKKANPPDGLVPFVNDLGLRYVTPLALQVLRNDALKRGPDLTGQRFGMLTAIAITGDLDGHPKWECRCDCGGITYIRGWCLFKGNQKSCGCVRTKLGRAMGKKCGATNGLANRGKRWKWRDEVKARKAAA